MANLKSHKTIEQLASKHGVSIGELKKQIEIGIKVEKEHTKNSDLAKDIALQHLDEFPDYYTKLTKMEKKSKNIKESHDEERYCPLCQKRETRSECSYGEKVWDKISVKDEEYSMTRSELSNIEDSVKKLKKVVGKGEGNLEAWVQSKITKAADYIDTAADYLSSGESTFEEKMLEAVLGRYKEDRGGGKSLRPASERIGSKPKKDVEPTGPKITKLKPKGPRKGEATASQVQGWRGSDRTNTNRRGQSAPHAKLIAKEENLVNKILKDIHEEDPCWKGYTQVGMKKKNGKEVPNCVPSKGVEKSKGYKKESVTIQDANGNDYVEFVDLIKPDPIYVDEAVRLQAEVGNIISVVLSWRGKYYTISMFFPQSKLPSRKEIEFEIQKIYPTSKVMHHSVSEIQPGQPLIRIPSGGSFAKPGSNKNYVKPMGEEVEIEEGMTMKDFKANRKKAKAAAARTDAVKRGHVGKEWYNSGRKYSPDEAKSGRANMDDEERRTRHRSAVDPDNEDDNNYSADKTKNPKKLRKQKAMGEISETKKSEMPCNKPKAEAHGSGETGKSHVVKACDGGKEKLIRFGQLGVKGSPKKKGESKEYASRRHRFQTRHAKNIAKGKMSAAYWANKVKW